MITYGVINAHMFGAKSAPGEYVNWSEPDIFTSGDFADMFACSPADYAEQNPHMIIFILDNN